MYRHLLWDKRNKCYWTQTCASQSVRVDDLSLEWLSVRPIVSGVPTLVPWAKSSRSERLLDLASWVRGLDCAQLGHWIGAHCLRPKENDLFAAAGLWMTRQFEAITPGWQHFTVRVRTKDKATRAVGTIGQWSILIQLYSPGICSLSYWIDKNI